MLSDVTNEKIKYANCGENRELLIDEIIRIGILDVSGNPIAGCKERICELYKSQPLSQKEFGEKLNALFAPNGYNPVSLPADDHTPYKPFKIVYNTPDFNLCLGTGMIISIWSVLDGTKWHGERVE